MEWPRVEGVPHPAKRPQVGAMSAEPPPEVAHVNANERRSVHMDATDHLFDELLLRDDPAPLREQVSKELSLGAWKGQCRRAGAGAVHGRDARRFNPAEDGA